MKRILGKGSASSIFAMIVGIHHSLMEILQTEADTDVVESLYSRFVHRTFSIVLFTTTIICGSTMRITHSPLWQNLQK